MRRALKNAVSDPDLKCASPACLTPLESTLTEVYENKGLYLPLESTLTQKQGEGVQ